MIKGKKFLVTAGPTYEPIDPVRFIGNRSSGKMGYYIAEELIKRGGEVILVMGPNVLQTSNPAIKRFDVETASEMFNICAEIFPICNVSIMTAAVSDFTPVTYSVNKIKKQSGSDELIIRLKKTKDILKHLGKYKKSNQILVGFSLETENEIANATAKLIDKNLDFIVLNTLNDAGAGFNQDTNKITIINSSGETKTYPLKNKAEVAKDIISYLDRLMQKRESQ
jgi:phosphopantothenoylcysteine decarboxylase / phosphopantothenate---cysteine ligase